MEMEIIGVKVIITSSCEKFVDEGGVMPISKRNGYFTITKPLLVSQIFWDIEGKYFWIGLEGVLTLDSIIQMVIC